MRLKAEEIAQVTGGRLVGPDVWVDGAGIDSRQIRPGQLFVPVTAARDGHRYIAAALKGRGGEAGRSGEAGAAAFLCRPGYLDGAEALVGGGFGALPATFTAIVVDDPMAALTTLGTAARDRLGDRVVGITGSVGKTTTKDLLASVLSQQWLTAASPGSFNNELGVPLTLLESPEGTEAVVVEMGARGRGHVAALVAVARPTVGIVTTVGVCHTHQFGSVESVARSKAELVAGLPSAGTAVLNGDVALVAAMAENTAARVLTFGLGTPEVASRPDVWADQVVLDDNLCASFVCHSPWGTAQVSLSVRGDHQVANALAVAAAALACGATLDDVVVGLGEARTSPWRMALGHTTSGAVVINDTYNANPLSVESALRSLATLAASRRVAVLGHMAELGHLSAAEHARMGALAAELGLEVIAVDEPAYGATTAATIAEAIVLLGRLETGDAVLVKGSRAAGLEVLAQALVTDH